MGLEDKVQPREGLSVGVRKLMAQGRQRGQPPNERGQSPRVAASPGIASCAVLSCEEAARPPWRRNRKMAPQAPSAHSGPWQTAFKSFISTLGPNHEEQGKNVQRKHLKSNLP